MWEATLEIIAPLRPRIPPLLLRDTETWNKDLQFEVYLNLRYNNWYCIFLFLFHTLVQCPGFVWCINIWRVVKCKSGLGTLGCFFLCFVFISMIKESRALSAMHLFLDCLFLLEKILIKTWHIILKKINYEIYSRFCKTNLLKCVRILFIST